MYSEQILNLKCAITGLQFKDFHPNVQKCIEQHDYKIQDNNIKKHIYYYRFMGHLANYLRYKYKKYIYYYPHEKTKEIIKMYNWVDDCPTDELLIHLASETI